MRKFTLSLAALAAISLVVPYAATAKADETVVVKHRHHHIWNSEPRHDKTVIIKHHHEHEHY
jgi:Spy/CpxP family protein refolding chaperone